MPLRDDLRGVGQRIVDFHDRGGDPPYLLYVYPPAQEWAVRSDLKELQLWLEAPDQRVRCPAVSLAELFWRALEEDGWIDELITQEIDADGDEMAMADIFRSVSEILHLPPSLPDRVIAAVEEFAGERASVFLYRAGALYPAYRTSTLIDDLRGRLRLPVTLLYPGSIVGDYGSEVHGSDRASLWLPGPHCFPGRSFVKISELFRGDIERPIETVIHVDLSDSQIVAHEIDEYVVTDNIRAHMEELVELYADTARNPSETTNVWVSGFFGSGKSSFAKMVGYALANPDLDGRTATERLLARTNSIKLEALLNTAHVLAPAITVFLDLSSGRDMLREGESLVLPVYRALLRRFGYSVNELLAELEVTLESEGRLDAFETAVLEATGARHGPRSAMSRWPRTTRAARCTSSTPPTSRTLTRGPRRPAAPSIDHNWLARRATGACSRAGVQGQSA